MYCCGLVAFVNNFDALFCFCCCFDLNFYNFVG